MVSKSLKKVRKEHKLTQQDIADVLGIDRSTYTFYETGKTMPSIKTLHALSNIYNVTMGYLAGYEENRPDLKAKHVASAASSDVDALAYLSKDEQLAVMTLRILSEEKRQELMKLIKNFL